MLDRIHASLLPEGRVSSAKNVTFEFGDMRHRWAAVMEVWGNRLNMGGNPLAMARWWEPETGEEALVVITDGERTTDDGIGRAWKVTPGGIPIEIPLNGHDVWGHAGWWRRLRRWC